ncbi:SipW-dependent-type signal peptide-containing protein [Mycoplasmatota bacterium]|nr:SipW-dependent-type signal peptide-containing protein [Mycoplasmatota bacterium]
MKKTYTLLSVLVLSLMVAGFSYAYWTDTLTVTGMAETGELSVIFECDSANPNPCIDNTQWGIYNTGTSEIIGNSKILQVHFDNLYPGAYADASACIMNNGTIPAKLKNIRLINVAVDGYNLSDAEVNELLDTLILGAYIRFLPNFFDDPLPNLPGVLTLRDNDNYFYAPGMLETVPLDVGDCVDFALKIHLLPESENPSQEKSFSFDVVLEYEQFNAPNVNP